MFCKTSVNFQAESGFHKLNRRLKPAFTEAAARGVLLETPPVAASGFKKLMCKMASVFFPLAISHRKS